jgi:hypothetical protein
MAIDKDKSAEGMDRGFVRFGFAFALVFGRHSGLDMREFCYRLDGLPREGFGGLKEEGCEGEEVFSGTLVQVIITCILASRRVRTGE